MIAPVLAIVGANTNTGEITPAAARALRVAEISPITRSASISRAT